MRPAILVAFVWAASAALPVGAQQTSMDFRLVPAASNRGGCAQMDTALSRPHTVTIKGTTAEVKSEDGIKETLKQSEPRVFQASTKLGPATLFVVADTSTAPSTLDVMEQTM